MTRGRGKDGTPYVQKDITKDMEKLNKMKPKSDAAQGEKDDDFLDDPKFKGKSKSKPVEIEIKKAKKVVWINQMMTKHQGKVTLFLKTQRGGEELDAAPAPSAPKDKKKEPEKKKDDPTEGGKYAYYEKDPKKRTKNSAMYMTQKAMMLIMNLKENHLTLLVQHQTF